MAEMQNFASVRKSEDGSLEIEAVAAEETSGTARAQGKWPMP